MNVELWIKGKLFKSGPTWLLAAFSSQSEGYGCMRGEQGWYIWCNPILPLLLLILTTAPTTATEASLADTFNATPCCAAPTTCPALPLLPRCLIKLTRPLHIECGYTLHSYSISPFSVSYSPIESETDWCGDKDEWSCLFKFVWS